MKSKNSINIAICVLAVVCTALVVLTVLTIAKDHKDSSGSQTRQESKAGDLEDTETVTYKGKQYKKDPNIRTMLFMGVDKDAKAEIGDNTGVHGQSDSLNLLAMNKETKEATVLQISRDSMVNIEIYSADGSSKLTTQHAQICLQYAYGDGEERSCKLVSDRVEELLMGVGVDYYLSLTLDGMIVATDAIGGVTLTVPEDYTAVDPAFTQGAEITLDGRMAEKYVRTRDIEILDSNNQRMDRQAQFMTALIDRMQEIKGSTQYAVLYQQLEPYMVTNMTADEMKAVSEYTIGDEMERVPGRIIEKDGHAQYIVNQDELNEIIISLFYIEK